MLQENRGTVSPGPVSPGPVSPGPASPGRATDGSDVGRTGFPGNSEGASAVEPLLPDYGGACLTSVVPALLSRTGGVPDWMPAELVDARQVVLLVLDGIGWELLQERRARVPTLAIGDGGPITSVAPSTTATALTSLSTGRAPAEHGIVGYRMRIDSPVSTSSRGNQTAGRASEVFNVLRWSSASGDLRRRLPADKFQRFEAFGGAKPPAVTRGEFASTGFTAAHLGGARLVGWHVPSSLVIQVRDQLRAGEPFVYAYYDGLDKVAHQLGLGDFYDEELRFVDRLVGDLIETLPAGGALVVTSDHGQVEVGGATRLPGEELLSDVELLSGEGRFRWLHVRPGSTKDVVEAAEALHGEEAWIRTLDEVIEEGWFGGPLSPEFAKRLGDVALVAKAAVAFQDPADTGETLLMGRHGSLTSSEMLVPLLEWSS